MPTITFFHGKNFTLNYWIDTALNLKKIGYNSLLIDQVGFGKSSKPTKFQYTFSSLSFISKKIIDHIGIKKTILIGHSMGGMLATKFSFLYPEKVNKLILVNPIGLEDYLNFVHYKDVHFFYNMELKKNKSSVIKYQKKNYYGGKWLKEYESIIEHLFAFQNGPDSKKIAWVNALTYEMIFSEPIIYILEYLKSPVFLFIGERDKTAPGRKWKKKEYKDYELGNYSKLGKDLNKRFKNLSLVELKGVGHLPHIENKDLFIRKLINILKYKD